jgi:hypothetical protein
MAQLFSSVGTNVLAKITETEFDELNMTDGN